MPTAATKALLEDWILGDKPVAWVGAFTYYDLTTGAEATRYFSWHRGRPYLEKRAPTVLHLPSLSISLLASDPAAAEDFASSPQLTQASGAPALASGFPGEAEVSIDNGEGTYDGLLDEQLYSWGGRAFSLHLGEHRDAWPLPTVLAYVFKGQPTAGVKDGREQITWRLRPAQLFNPAQPLHAALGLYFTGGGGVNGGPHLAGHEKPIALGRFTGHRPTPLDTIGKTYLVDGLGFGIEEVTKVYRGGFALTLTTDYTVDLDESTITLVDEPSAPITCDGKGAKFDGGAYSENAAKIARELLRLMGVASGSVDLNGYDTAVTAPVAVNFSGGRAVTGEEALARALRPRGGWYQTPDGTKVKLILLRSPHDQTVGQAYVDKDLRGVEFKEMRRPLSQARVGYGRIVEPLTDFVGAVGAAETARQGFEWRYATVPTTPLTGPHSDAQPVAIETPFALAADAETEGAVQVDRWRDPKRLVDATLARKPLFSEPGDFVSFLKTDERGATPTVRYNMDRGGDLELEGGGTIDDEAGDPIELEGGGVTKAQVVATDFNLETREFRVVGVT